MSQRCSQRDSPGRSWDCDENSIKIETLYTWVFEQKPPQYPRAQRPLPLHTPTFQMQPPADPENATWIWFSDLRSCFAPPASITLHADLHEQLDHGAGVIRDWSIVSEANKGHPGPSRIRTLSAIPSEPGCEHLSAESTRSRREARGGRPAVEASLPP